MKGVKNNYRELLKRTEPIPKLSFTGKRRSPASVMRTYVGTVQEYRPAPLGHVDLAAPFEDCIMEIAQEVSEKTMRAVDLEYPTSFWERLLDRGMRLLRLRHELIDVLVLANKGDQRHEFAWNTYKRLFERYNCKVKRVTSEMVLPRQIKALKPTLIHCLMPVRANPVKESCVRVATFDYDESSAEAKAASNVAFGAYGYEDAVCNPSSSLLFFKKFYSRLLVGAPMARSYRDVRASVEFPPYQYLSMEAKCEDRSIFVVAANLLEYKEN